MTIKRHIVLRMMFIEQTSQEGIQRKCGKNRNKDNLEDECEPARINLRDFLFSIYKYEIMNSIT